MKDLIIICLIIAFFSVLLAIRIDANKANTQLASCQDSLRDYRNYLEQLRAPTTAPETDSLLVGNMFWNYVKLQVGFYRQAITDADAAALIPQTPECLVAYQWLREKRGYSPAKAIKLTIRWWEKQ